MALTKLRSTIAGDPIYAKVAEYDSDGKRIVTPLVTRISKPDNAWHIDRTFAEIKSAYDTGAPVIVLFEGGSSDNIFVGQIDRVYETTNNHWKIDFQQVSYPNDLNGHRTITIMKAFLDDENTLTVNVYEHVIMPDALHQSSVADEYSASSTYAAKSLVTHDGILYTNPNAISTAEDWTAAHWTQVTVSGLIGDVETLLAAL